MSQTNRILKAIPAGAPQRYRGDRLRVNISPTERVGRTVHCPLYQADRSAV